MTSLYLSGSLDTFVGKVDNSDYVLASHINELQDAASAVETVMGASPASASLITGKGSLFVGKSASAVGGLPVGADTTVLTANSACNLGMYWASVAAVPSKAVLFFDDIEANIPSGWTNKCAAWGGRFLVAMPASGTKGGTVGAALTNLQDLTHSHTGPSHQHNQSVGSYLGVSYQSLGLYGTGDNNTASISNNTSSSAGYFADLTKAAGTGSTGNAATSNVAPYVQLPIMEKN